MDKETLDAVLNLDQFIGGKMYSVTDKAAAKGWEITVCIPYGSTLGKRLFLKALRLFAITAWRVLA